MAAVRCHWRRPEAGLAREQAVGTSAIRRIRASSGASARDSLSLARQGLFFSSSAAIPTLPRLDPSDKRNEETRARKSENQTIILWRRNACRRRLKALEQEFGGLDVILSTRLFDRIAERSVSGPSFCQPCEPELAQRYRRSRQRERLFSRHVDGWPTYWANVPFQEIGMVRNSVSSRPSSNPSPIYRPVASIRRS